MKTIEERAKKASEGYDDEGYSAGIYVGYKEGATEQKSIDDAHLAEIVSQWKEEEKMWIKQESSGKELLYVVDKTTQRVKKEMIDKACEAHCFLCEYYNDCLVAGVFRCHDTEYIREQMEE